MSFLNSVLSSIETGKSAAIPSLAPRSQALTTSGATLKSDDQKCVPAPVNNNASTRTVINTSAGMKRKAEGQLQRPEKPNGHAPGRLPSSKTPGTSAAVKARPTPLTHNGPPVSPKPQISTAPSKPPPKGSFADLMAKARAVQEKAPVKVGVLKHQAVPKEKLSKAEKKKRAMEVSAKDKESQLSKKFAFAAGSSATTRVGGKPGEGPSVKRREPEENAYKGTARPSQPSYRGTAGLPPSRQRAVRGRADDRRGRSSRRDDYLGTDEEDESDYYGNNYDDYYSDESSDMEAGIEDVEKEEELALRTARREDEEDIQKELAAKREKLERKKKLAGLASKSRR